MIAVALLFGSRAVSADIQGSTDISNTIFDVTMPVLCGIYQLLVSVAGAIATFVLVYAGVRWIGSNDDPGERKVAKTVMIYTVVGLVIVIVAASLVSLMISGEILPC
jgi:uncharacterized membrane protein YidH (DUF202 family)